MPYSRSLVSGGFHLWDPPVIHSLNAPGTVTRWYSISDSDFQSSTGSSRESAMNRTILISKAAIVTLLMLVPLKEWLVSAIVHQRLGMSRFEIEPRPVRIMP